MSLKTLKGIKQYATFINTEGVIESERNIYYVPFTIKEQSSIAKLPIGKKYRTKLIEACGGVNEEYLNINISRWSPEDRTLSIQGSIDVFRKSTTQKLVFNYVIIKREIYEDNTFTNLEEYYYLGYFIKDVKQTGMNTIKLSIEPDNFTNAFFLSNRRLSVGGDYADDFINNITNMYVERTHLDRIEEVQGDDGNSIYVARPEEYKVFINNEERYRFNYQIKDYAYPISFNGGTMTEFTKEDIETIRTTSKFTSLPENIKNKIINCCLVWGVVKCKEPISTNIVSKSGQPTTSLKEAYVNAPKKGFAINKIPTPMQTIVLPAINIRKEFKKYQSYIENVLFSFNINLVYGLSESTLTQGWNKVSTATSTPEYDMQYDKYFTHDKNTTLPFLTLETFLSHLNTNSWSDRILSITVVRDLPINYNITFGVSSYEINFKGGALKTLALAGSGEPEIDKGGRDNYNVNIAGKPLNKGIWGCFIPNNLAQVDSGASIEKFNTEDDEWDFTIVWKDDTIDKQIYFGMILSGTDTIDSSIDLDELILTNEEAKTKLFDAMLETNPYKFYTISYTGGIEIPIDKQKYFGYYNEQAYFYRVPTKYIHSNNDNLKISIILTYNNGGVDYLAFADALTISLTSQLPMSNDSYQSYYYTNLAQMKNAFAVNNLQRGTSMANHVLNEAPANVGSSFIQGNQWGIGGVSALTQGIKETSKLVTSIVDWTTSNAVIDMTNKAELAGAGAKPDTIKQAGTDVYFDLQTGDFGYMLNHYTIDDKSSETICKYLERYGYLVNRYMESIDIFSRVNYNYLKLKSFDFSSSGLDLNDTQKEAISNILYDGITLLHEPTKFGTEFRNYETILGR